MGDLLEIGAPGWRSTPELCVLLLGQCRDGWPPGKRCTRVEKNSRVMGSWAWAVQGWVTFGWEETTCTRWSPILGDHHLMLNKRSFEWPFGFGEEWESLSKCVLLIKSYFVVNPCRYDLGSYHFACPISNSSRCLLPPLPETLRNRDSLLASFITLLNSSSDTKFICQLRLLPRPPQNSEGFLHSAPHPVVVPPSPVAVVRPLLPWCTVVIDLELQGASESSSLLPPKFIPSSFPDARGLWAGKGWAMCGWAASSVSESSAWISSRASSKSWYNKGLPWSPSGTLSD